MHPRGRISGAWYQGKLLMYKAECRIALSGQLADVVAQAFDVQG
jgi:hypothetical protein